MFIRSYPWLKIVLAPDRFHLFAGDGAHGLVVEDVLALVVFGGNGVEEFEAVAVVETEERGFMGKKQRQW